jgi:hypothetical protein
VHDLTVSAVFPFNATGIDPASGPAAVLTGNPFHSEGAGGHQHLNSLGGRERAGDPVVDVTKALASKTSSFSEICR